AGVPWRRQVDVRIETATRVIDVVWRQILVVDHRRVDLAGLWIERDLSQARDATLRSGNDPTRRHVALVSSPEDQQSRHAAGTARVGRHDEQVAIGIDGDADHLKQFGLRPLNRPQWFGVAVCIALVDEDAAITWITDEQLVVLLVHRDCLRTREAGPRAL